MNQKCRAYEFHIHKSLRLFFYISPQLFLWAILRFHHGFGGSFMAIYIFDGVFGIS